MTMRSTTRSAWEHPAARAVQHHQMRVRPGACGAAAAGCANGPGGGVLSATRGVDIRPAIAAVLVRPMEMTSAAAIASKKCAWLRTGEGFDMGT